MSRIDFLIRTAWRDARQNMGKLLLFMSSIVLGISALVAINSFNYNLAQDIDREAASLLGADLVVTGNREAGPITRATLDSLPAQLSTGIELLSMAYLPKVDESHFVRIKALQGDFPFYGALESNPIQAADLFKSHQGALVEDGLMTQYGLQVGDSIQLGKSKFSILGELKNAFGSASISSSFAPTIYIGKQFLPGTGLVQPGSLLNYAYYYKIEQPFEIDEWKEERVTRLRTESMRMETVTDRQANIGDAFDNLNYFLNLVAMVALLLGCIGVASSVFIYIKNKIPSIAILRCLGMKGKEAFFVYFAQIIGLGALGVVVGCLLGSVVQIILPRVLTDFIPLEVQMKISWPAMLQGLTIGLLITSLFSVLPLLGIRKISPLRTLRQNITEPTSKIDLPSATIYFAIVFCLFGFLWLLTDDPLIGFYFVVGLGAAFGLLFLVARLVMWSVKMYFPKHWNFVLRQGLANLFRPNNQTRTLLVSIGLGTAVLTTLFIVQGLLLRNVAAMDAGEQPNVFLFGIESNQIDSLVKITEAKQMPIIQNLPVVTMRLVGWQGKTKKEWLADSNLTAKSWAIHRETRATYRDWLDSNEKVIAGDFPHPYRAENDSIFISLAKPFADAMNVDLGDEMIFNVQGARMKTYVKSIRKIENANMRARFLVLFPSGVLEPAPKFHILVTKSPNVTTTANFRSEVVKEFSNVSVIDLSTILESINEILTKVSYIIQFMALFSILTGLTVLFSSLLLSKYQRIRESVLLRTLGASRRQIQGINLSEYVILGTLAASLGVVIALVASFLLARFQLDLDFNIRWLPIAIVFFSVVMITVVIGVLNSREVVNRPPLEVLRREVG